MQILHSSSEDQSLILELSPRNTIMSPPDNHHIFCCSTAKIIKASISHKITGRKLIEFAISAVKGKFPCRPRFAFDMEDEDVGDFLFSVSTTESKIAHSITEFFCNFHATGPNADPSILVVEVPKPVLREDFELDEESEIFLECTAHDDISIELKVLKRRIKEEVSDPESTSNPTSDPGSELSQVSAQEQMTDPESGYNHNCGALIRSDPGHTSGSESDQIFDLDSVQMIQSDAGTDRSRTLAREWL
ncbi:hypothetical protein BKA64DRAFT_661266 [Cadophora sp. MPI-SDFR-AT-0126]|nr:hypothetical protein BKA64DRAFT_661266 [Leotiomycetes sp. MPI-SDFR-AT-0126]